ncbi:hypothetical protein QK289_14285 [Exiguobacterium antarcticum]|uniref:DUF4355 domain-containing protein n=1 Tax=Exiguobacterium antarcticum TaxID=132920 RepID=A0ABT6R5F0_9BACL|nr:hypothetical protein [Exiguobacterium antarcticum]MDI3236179.1 hypothetical protein [Exiguobacterium antarcticum]
MHNQDSAKDDVLETFLELLKEFQKYLLKQYKEILKQRELQKNAEALENQMSNTLNGNEKDEYKDFKEAMKYIGENTSNPKIKDMAKLFHDNPKDGLALIQEANKQQGRDAISRVDQTSPVIISNLKKLEMINNNRDTPNEQTAKTLKELIKNEEGNMQVAATTSKEIEQSFEIKGHTISNDDLKEIANAFNESIQKKKRDNQLDNSNQELSSTLNENRNKSKEKTEDQEKDPKELQEKEIKKTKSKDLEMER